MKRTIGIIGCMLLLLPVSGCLPGGGPDVEHLRAILAQAEVETEATAASIAALPASPTKDKATAVLDKATEVLAALEKATEGATDAPSLVKGTATAIAPLLPPPWGLAVTGVSSLVTIISLALAKRTRTAAINNAKAIGPYIGSMTDEEKAKVSAAQGAAGKEIVDIAQGKKKRGLL